MTPKEKAKELIEKFDPLVDYQDDDCLNEREKMLKNAKQCALIAVREILKLYKKVSIETLAFYAEVETEIENYE